MRLRILTCLVFLSFPFVLGGTQEKTEKKVPEPPINLTIKTSFEGATAVAALRWIDESDNELGFEILRSSNGEESKVVAAVGANTVHYEDKIGKYVTGSFTYRVRAFNQAGKSKPCRAVTVWY